MPNLNISIGGREFEVACQEGEEHFLESAARMLDAEAAVLVNQIGRMPEGRMLLMAGLMLADKTAGMQDQLSKALAETKAMRGELDALKAQQARIDVDGLAALADKAEALAERLETGPN